MNPLSPAHCFFCSSSWVLGSRCTKFSTAETSSIGHVFPIEKVPLAFSLALCSLTLPVFRTEIMIMRPFLLEADEVGGGGDCG
jgi:hypothetical protein